MDVNTKQVEELIGYMGAKLKMYLAATSDNNTATTKAYAEGLARATADDMRSALQFMLPECTGYINDHHGMIEHDGNTCSEHEA